MYNIIGYEIMEITKEEFYREKLLDENRSDRLLEQRNKPDNRFCRMCGKEIYPEQTDFSVIYPDVCNVCGTVQE